MSEPRIQRWLRFIVGGGINTGVTYILYLIFNTMLNYQLAYFIAYVFGVFFSYWFNSKFVFRVPLSWKKFLSYPVVYIVQYFLSASLLGLFVEYFEVSELFAPIVVVILLVPITYIMSKLILKGNVSNDVDSPRNLGNE